MSPTRVAALAFAAGRGTFTVLVPGTDGVDLAVRRTAGDDVDVQFVRVVRR